MKVREVWYNFFRKPSKICECPQFGQFAEPLREEPVLFLEAGGAQYAPNRGTARHQAYKSNTRLP